MTLDQAQVVAKFRARRRGTIILTVPFVLAVLAGFLSPRIATLIHTEPQTAFFVAWGVAVACAIPAYLIYRCPNCDSLILGYQNTVGNLLNLTTTKCSKCGVSFK